MGSSDAILTRHVVAQSQTAPRVEGTRNAAEARRVAEDFEAFFLAQMLENMFSGITTDGPFGGGHAESIYRSLLNGEYGKLLSRTGGIGVADAVQREILKLQESEKS